MSFEAACHGEVGCLLGELDGRGLDREAFEFVFDAVGDDVLAAGLEHLRIRRGTERDADSGVGIEQGATEQPLKRTGKLRV